MPIDIAKIITFYKQHKRMPSYAELAELYRFKSKQAAFRLAQKLIDRKILKKDTKGYLLPGADLFKVPLLGSVKTGFPSPADDYANESIDLNELFNHSPTASFVAQSSGDSMEDAGIFEGDYLSIRRDLAPKNGNIVIARVDTEFTCKYYKKTGNTVTLFPANEKYTPIHITNEMDFEVWGVVVGVVRKLI
jgi:repressor LexA